MSELIIGYAVLITVSIVVNAIILFIAAKITSADLSPVIFWGITIIAAVPQFFLPPLQAIGAKFGLLLVILMFAGDTDSIVDVILLLIVYTILNVLVALTLMVKLAAYVAEHPEKFGNIPGFSSASTDSDDDDDDDSGDGQVAPSEQTPGPTATSTEENDDEDGAEEDEVGEDGEEEDEDEEGEESEEDDEAQLYQPLYA